MTRLRGTGHGGTIALYAALGLSVLAAALVSVYLQATTPLMLPVALCVMPFFARTCRQARVLRAIAAILLGLFAYLGSLSVGLLFAPAAFAMAMSVAGMRSARRSGQ